MTILKYASSTPAPAYLSFLTAYLGSLPVLQGKLDKAEELTKKAIVIGEKILGKEHVDVAVWYNNLGNIYQDQVSSCDNPPSHSAVRWRPMGVSHTQSLSNT